MSDMLEEILKDTPFSMKAAPYPPCMAPDGAEPCKQYQELKAEVERLDARVVGLEGERDYSDLCGIQFEQEIRQLKAKLERAALDIRQIWVVAEQDGWAKKYPRTFARLAALKDSK